MLTAERVNGVDIQRIVTTQGMDSIRARTQKLSELQDIHSVIFLGSTCVGKSTIEQAVRTASFKDFLLRGKICVPLRVVTRLSRLDDTEDMYFCSSYQFEAMRVSNKLGLYGIKIMEDERQEPYGYLKPDDGTLPIFFANNQTFKNKANTGPEEILDNALIVLIYAPDSVREARLRIRSPRLFQEKPKEVAFRLSKEERAIGLVGAAHLIVRNYGRYASRSVQDVIELIKFLVSERKELIC